MVGTSVDPQSIQDYSPTKHSDNWLFFPSKMILTGISLYASFIPSETQAITQEDPRDVTSQSYHKLRHNTWWKKRNGNFSWPQKPWEIKNIRCHWFDQMPYSQKHAMPNQNKLQKAFETEFQVSAYHVQCWSNYHSSYSMPILILLNSWLHLSHGFELYNHNCRFQKWSRPKTH